MPPDPPEGASSAHTWILDFQPLELGDNKCLLSKVPQFIAVCHRTREYLCAQSGRKWTCLGEGTAQPWLLLRDESLGG